MPAFTRRKVLAGMATGLTALAGCSGSSSRHNEVPRHDAEPVEYDFVRTRSTSEPTLFWTGERDASTESETRQRVGREYLATAADVDAVEFVATEHGDRLQTFVSETDFETESVFLYSTPVSQCHEVHLRAVTVEAEDGDPHLDFCQSVRPADFECSEAITDTVAYAVRLPTDGRDVTGTGTGMSHGCSDPSVPSTFDTTVTVHTEGEQ